MPFGATPSRWCVCQFHHFRTLVMRLRQYSSERVIAKSPCISQRTRGSNEVRCFDGGVLTMEAAQRDMDIVDLEWEIYAVIGCS